MYKVYENSLLNELSEHNFAICISSMKLSALSFAADISLFVLYPTFLQHFLNIACLYSLKWRYEFNNIKSGIVNYGESKPSHFANVQERSWTLGAENVDELCECKNLGVYKNYYGSFNPTQAGVFWYHIGWYHIVFPPPCVSPFLVVQLSPNLA